MKANSSSFLDVFYFSCATRNISFLLLYILIISIEILLLLIRYTCKIYMYIYVGNIYYFV